MNVVAQYLHELQVIHASGSAVKETSYYGPLERLLNAVGGELKPRVQAVMTLRNQGAGMPDGGLFTTDQLQRGTANAPLPGQLPGRGVIEVKGTGANVGEIAQSEQVRRYLDRYGQVLVCNYRDFLLLERGADGAVRSLERYQLAPDERAFWAADPQHLSTEHGVQLVEYLKRVMLHAATLSNPSDVAWFLASYARDARARVERHTVPALANIRTALEGALGVTFKAEQGDRFFRSTLIQTLFYGVFSAWVLWHEENPERIDRFDWRVAEHYLHVPVIQALFEQVSAPTRLRPLGLVQVLDWTGAVLNRVDRVTFFQKFDQGLAVQYFYEPFLEAFDPDLRKQLGVWYTPREVVRYMVRRVDQALRDQLGIADGLADRNVYVLDPCCGTGTYLVEVIQTISITLRAKGDDALLGADLKRAAMERVFGFELLPAPFVVAHLQLGLLLQQFGIALNEEQQERAAIYLTNALTGWEPPDPAKERVVQLRLEGLPELQQERDAAEHVKRDVPILVILGNPPYNGFAGVAVAEERALSNAYRTTKRAPVPAGQGLNDLYVRFFRMAERRITERTGKGIVCFISNYSWLDGLSFPGMREHYLEAFDSVTIDSLNGDKYKTGKLTPEGEPDPSVFSTPFNPEGIQVGTAIALLVSTGQHGGTNQVRFRHLWGRTKRAQLLEALDQPDALLYQSVTPALGLGLPFLPAQVEANYLAWPLLPDLFPVSFPGVKTSRDDVVVDIDRDRLVRRMSQYFDPQVSHDEMRRIAPRAMDSTPRFNAETTRDQLRRRGFLPQNIMRYYYRPYDLRWLYWEGETKLLDEKRAEYVPHVFAGNIFLFTTGRTRKGVVEPGVTVKHAMDLNCMDSGARGFPLYLKREGLLAVGNDADRPLVNLSQQAERYILGVGASQQDLFYHCLSILHSSQYRQEHTDALRSNWPRIPLPASPDLLRASAQLGRQIAALLDTEMAVVGVTEGTIRHELRPLAVATRVGGGMLDPNGDDLAVQAGWGHGGNGGSVMPGRGHAVERFLTAEEQALIGATTDEVQALALLGSVTYDVYLNDIAYWRNIPRNVWEYTLGGYQVIKKWLSYREHGVLGRALTLDEVREVTNMARRIAAILLLEPQLDANYLAIKQATYAES